MRRIKGIGRSVRARRVERPLFSRAWQRGCMHRNWTICDEDDGCYWVECSWCGKRGPHKHSLAIAVMAWIVRLADQHPRRMTKRQERNYARRMNYRSRAGKVRRRRRK